MNKHRGFQGFTIVELIVVVVVLAIIITLTTLGITKFTTDSRDTSRAANATVIAEALEKYYDLKGEYPSCPTISQNASLVASNVLAGIDIAALRTPTAASGINSIRCNQELSANTEDFFLYVGDTNTICQTTSATCYSFILKYLNEAEGSIKEIESRRGRVAVSFTTAPVLTGTPFQYYTARLSWGAVAGATGYSIQYSTSSTFATFSTKNVGNATTTDVTNLTSTSPYYFRIKATAGASSSPWSNTITITSTKLTAPTVSTVANSATQMTASWPAVTGATHYTVERATNNTFTAGLVKNTITTRTTTATGLTPGVAYYYRVTPLYNGIAGPSSAIVTRTLAGVAPTLTTVANSNTQITASWPAVADATQYRVQRATNASFSTGLTTTDTNDTNLVINGLTQGQIYYFRAMSLYGSTAGPASNTTSITLGVTTPAAPTVSLVTSDPTAIRWNWSPASCPAGTTAEYQYSFATGTTASTSWSGPTNGVSWVPSTANEGYSYTVAVRQRCVGTTSSSSYGALASRTFYRAMTTPGAPTNFVATFNSTRASMNIRWTEPTCGPGTSPYVRYSIMYRTSPSATPTAWTDVTEGHYLPNVTIGEKSGGTFPVGYGFRTMALYQCVNGIGVRSAWGPSGTSPWYNMP